MRRAGWKDHGYGGRVAPQAQTRLPADVCLCVYRPTPFISKLINRSITSLEVHHMVKKLQTEGLRNKHLSRDSGSTQIRQAAHITPSSSSSSLILQQRRSSVLNDNRNTVRLLKTASLLRQKQKVELTCPWPQLRLFVNNLPAVIMSTRRGESGQLIVFCSKWGF